MTTRQTRKFFFLTIILVALLVPGVTGCTQGETEATTTEETAESEPATTPPPAQPEEEAVYTPSYTPNGTEIAVIETEKGTIKFEFYSEDAPNHSAAFIERAQEGFYDGTKFHRVEPGFVIQGGDPLSKTDDPAVGTGGPGYTLAEEFSENKQKHLDGTVAMARSQDPNSAGSQFYICLGPQPFLDGQYTVFGQVTEGLDVVHTIAVGDVMQSVTIENAEQ